MYVTMFPCNECSKLLIQAGIREIVYYEDKAAPVQDTSPNEAAQSNIRQVNCCLPTPYLHNGIRHQHLSGKVLVPAVL